MEWYYAREGAQHGPVDQAAFDACLRDGVITAETLVWNPDLPNWEPWGILAERARERQADAVEIPCAECGELVESSAALHFQKDTICGKCKDPYFLRLFQGTSGALDWIPAPLFPRVLAHLLDQMIVNCVNLVLSAGYILLPGEETEFALILFYFILSLGGFILSLLYEVCFIWKFGATPGKMVFKIEVVVADGSRVSFLRSVGRYFAKILSGMIMGIGYLMILFDVERRGLHDRICDTIVVRKENANA